MKIEEIQNILFLQQRKILQVKHYFQKFNIFIRRVGEEEEKKERKKLKFKRTKDNP